MCVISLSWKPSDKFLLIRMQLHPSFIAEYDLIASYLDFKCFLVHAGFLAAVQLFSHSSITCALQSSLTSFCWLDQFSSHPVLQFLRATTSWSFWNTSSALKFWKGFWDVASWNSVFLSYFLLADILGHLHYFHPRFYGNFHYDFRCKIFHFKKKLVLLQKNICILVVEYFSVFKTVSWLVYVR